MGEIDWGLWAEWMRRYGWILVVALWGIGSVIEVLRGRSEQERGKFTRLRLKLAGPPLEALERVFEKVKEAMVENGKEISAEEAYKEIQKLTEDARKAADRVVRRLRGHLGEIWTVVVVGEEAKGDNQGAGMRTWRLIGAVISVVLLGAFVYADLVQGVNNFSLLYPAEVASLPDWTKNIVVSLVMSSVGTALALGFIMADARGITHFLPWRGIVWGQGREENAEEWIRRRVFRTAMGAFVLTLILLMVMALPRAMGVAAVGFTAEVERGILYAAAVAHVLIIVPMLITTAMLFWGIIGVVMAYGAGVGILQLFGWVVKGVFYSASKVIRIVEPGSRLFIYLVLVFIAAVFVSIGLVVGTLLVFVDALTYAVVTMVRVVFYYPFSLMERVFVGLRKGQ